MNLILECRRRDASRRRSDRNAPMYSPNDQVYESAAEAHQRG